MKIEIVSPQTQKTNYGTFKPLYFEGRFRYDEYQSHSTKETILESILCLNSNDLSHVKTYRPTYEERQNCHCCFAGYGHTLNLCNENQTNKR